MSLTHAQALDLYNSDDLIGIGSVSARAAFVIDKAGVIQYSEQTPTPKELPNFDAIKAKLASLS